MASSDSNSSSSSSSRRRLPPPSPPVMEPNDDNDDDDKYDSSKTSPVVNLSVKERIQMMQRMTDAKKPSPPLMTSLPSPPVMTSSASYVSWSRQDFLLFILLRQSAPLLRFARLWRPLALAVKLMRRLVSCLLSPHRCAPRRQGI